MFYSAGLVLTQFALREAPPWRGAAISVPSAALMFWALAPFLLDLSNADMRGAAIFAAVGVLFPAAVTLLSMEANRRMGPNVAGAIGNVTPLFAVLFAVMVLGEALHLPQAIGVAVIMAGVMLLSVDRSRATGDWPLWALALPVSAAVVRGIAPPTVKLGFAFWPDAFVATLIGYTASAAVLMVAARVRSRGRLPHVDLRGRAWYVVVGLCNGLSVLLLYAALARGPVALIVPLFATYPLVTLLLSRALLRQELLTGRLAIGVAATVAGVVLLIAG